MDNEGFTVRRNWRRALASWRGMVDPVANHEQTLELILALAGPAFQDAYDEFRADPNGQRLLAERPDIVSVLVDRTTPYGPGTLGHAYRDFMDQNRLDAELYESAHDLPAIAERLGWDDDFHYVVHRGIALHDMLHVLGGYGPDVGGEAGVIAFTHGQVPNWGTRLFLPLVLVLPVGVPKRRLVSFWRESVRRGAKAGLLMAQPYEELMDVPLDEVRRRLGVPTTEEAHPEGIPWSPFQFGPAKRRRTEVPYEPYVYDPGAEVDVMPRGVGL